MLRHVLTAVLAWALVMLTGSGVGLMWLVYRGKVDLASGTTLGGLFTIFSGIVVIILRALIVGARLSDTNGNGNGDGETPHPPRDPESPEPGQ
jgi:hypothetical protein